MTKRFLNFLMARIVVNDETTYIDAKPEAAAGGMTCAAAGEALVNQLEGVLANDLDWLKFGLPYGGC